MKSLVILFFLLIKVFIISPFSGKKLGILMSLFNFFLIVCFLHLSGFTLHLPGFTFKSYIIFLLDLMLELERNFIGLYVIYDNF